MTEPKIINGVDVSECVNYRNYQGLFDDCISDVCLIALYQKQYQNFETMSCNCKNNSNCYYKQLKRKEQELKAICEKFDIEYITDKKNGAIYNRCNKLLHKEQECDKYKKFINDLYYYLLKFQKDLGQTDMLCVEVLNKINEVENER